jgi:PAS domain S-box-containing protein
MFKFFPQNNIAKEVDRRLQLYIDCAGDAIYILDAKTGRIVNCNVQASIDLGYTRDELLNLSAKDIEARLTPDEIDAVHGRAAESNATLMEGVHKRKDNSTFPVEIRLSVLDFAQGKYLIAIARNITERKEAQKALFKSEERYRQLFDASPDGVILIGPDARIERANAAMAQLYRYDSPKDMIGVYPPQLVAPSSREYSKQVIQRRLHGEDIPLVEYELVRKDGTKFYGETTATILRNADGTVSGYICVTRDTTERKQSQEALQKVQKLESLGMLAGGIAHDFNNLMGGIFGYIDLASGQSKDGKVTQYLSKALATIDRARGLTRQLLTFAKGGVPVKRIGNLFPFVQETAQFALSGSNVSCHYDIANDLWACNFDKNQIGQVIDNIVINAQQAMFAGGAIELTACNIAVAEKEHPILGKGNYVRISIKDSGVGIPKEMLGRIFDPFFTTKAKGHGLGLATCYSIINHHGGCIDVESEPGKGAAFHVYLPASMETADFSKKVSEIKHVGSGTVLVMDDEEVIRDAIHDMLVSIGYTVVCKENGKDAIDFFTMELQAKRTLSAMIFDLTVPGGMGGKDAALEIRKLNAEIPIFVSSGYANDPVMKNPAEYGFTASICKPFTKVELAQMLNKHLRPV